MNQVLINTAIIISIIYLFYKNLCKSKKEGFAQEVMEKNIKKIINKTYLTDIDAIRNLSDIAVKLQKGGITIPGDLTVKGKLNYLPKGTIVAFNGTKAPSGWVICNGRNGTPDLRGRFIYGFGTRLGNKFKRAGGSESHKLSWHEMPSHNHGNKVHSGGKHSHVSVRNWNHYGELLGSGSKAFSGGGGAHFGHGGTVFRTDDHSGHGHRVDIHHSGSNRHHNNMPPYVVLLYIMKI